MVDEDPGSSRLDALIGEAREYATDRRSSSVPRDAKAVLVVHENSDASVRLDHGNGSATGTGRQAA